MWLVAIYSRYGDDSISSEHDFYDKERRIIVIVMFDMNEVMYSVQSQELRELATMCSADGRRGRLNLLSMWQADLRWLVGVRMARAGKERCRPRSGVEQK